MKLIPIFLLFILLIQFGSASAGAVAATIAAEDEAYIESRRGESIEPPQSWAEENDCILQYPHRGERRVGSYFCASKNNSNYSYMILAKGNGSVEIVGTYISYSQSEQIKDFLTVAILIMLAMLIGIFIVYLIKRIKIKK